MRKFSVLLALAFLFPLAISGFAHGTDSDGTPADPAGSDAGNAPLRCSDGTTGTGIYTGHVSAAKAADLEPSPVSGTISASPNPCTIAAGKSTCTTTLEWSATGTDRLLVRVSRNGAASTVLASSGAKGSASPKWIKAAPANTYTFSLYDYAGRVQGKLLDSVIVTGEDPARRGSTPGEFDNVEVLLTCGNGVFEKTVPGSDGGFTFEGLSDGDYVITVRKPGYRGPAARPFRLEGGLIVSPPPGEINREYVLTPLDPNTFVFHWEEDQSTAGYDYQAHVNQPLEVEFLGKPIEANDSLSAVRLNRSYNILLADSESGTWTQGHAYRLLETMKTIPQEDQLDPHAQKHRPSRWLLTSDHVENDIQITGGPESDRTVLISEAAFVNASPRIALIEGKRGRYYSRRLHHALVRFVTDNGRDEWAYERILQERFGVTTLVNYTPQWLPGDPGPTTYRDLTASTTGEDASRFQKFHSEEVVQIINTLEEMPTGMHKSPELKYLVRRLDGTPHPLYPGAPAVAWTGPGYIEFMEKAFLNPSITGIHRLILHEKAHFLWAHLFDEQLKADWIELGGWYEDVRSPSGWSTTKQTEFVSSYAHEKNPNEDMAESVAFFVVNPDKLKSRAIGKYEFVRDRVMQGNFYISQIREDLTFEVYNLFPDYVFPGKIRRVDIRVTGAAEEDKAVQIEVELHALDKVLEGAKHVFMRIASEADTWTDVYLYPVGVPYGEPGTVLSGGFTLSKYAKAGYWFPVRVNLVDPVGNERFERGEDFGWSLYVNNPLEDVTPPEYVRDSVSLRKYTDQVEGREVQVIEATWKVEEKSEITNCEMTLTVNVDTYSFHGSGPPGPGLCRARRYVPDYLASGTYTLVWIGMGDVAGNYNDFRFGDTSDPSKYEAPLTTEIVTANPDLEAPELDVNALKISAEPTNPAAPNGETVVTLNYRIRDNLSGVYSAYLYLRDPQGVEHYFQAHPKDGYLHGPGGNWFPSRDPSQWSDETWSVVLPPGSVPGIWGLAEMSLRDRAGNVQHYDFTETIHFDVIE